MKNKLTNEEFNAIRNELFVISDTWADLWMLLKLTNEKPTRLLKLTYIDESKGVLTFKDKNAILKQAIKLNFEARQLIRARYRRYPDDIYVFQSHSNRKKYVASPVTLVAFNNALKLVSQRITDKKVSSKSARNLGQNSCLNDQQYY